MHSPRIELSKTDCFFHVKLRKILTGQHYDAFVTNGIIDVTSSYHGQQLFLTIFLDFLYIDGISYFVAEILDT